MAGFSSTTKPAEMLSFYPGVNNPIDEEAADVLADIQKDLV